MADDVADRSEVDSSGATVPAAGGAPRPADETLPGSLHARVVRGLSRGATVGRYLVLEEIGRGGMGVVYAAYDPDLDRRIAIKVLHGRSEEGAAGNARLLREAQALAKLAHPNVIAVFDVGTVPVVAAAPGSAAPGAAGEPLDEVFVAMELVPGATLREATAGKPWREVVAAYVAAGRGLAAAHAAGLVHRDFKPENVLVGADGRPRVTDFGLVRATSGGADEAPGRPPSSPTALESALTAAGTVMGTPSYMAPEQMVGESTSAATDQYSFAVALWEALFASRPYAGKDVAAVHAAVVAGRRTPYERGEVPMRIVRALERALAATPDARWPAMDALLAELDVAARPPAPRWLAAGLVVLGLVVLAVGGVIALGGRRGDDECARAGDDAAALWSRAPVEAAFRAAAPGFGPDAMTLIETQIGAWRDDWQRRARAACTATRIQRTQSDEVLDLRTSCLSRKLDAARALVDGLTHADRDTVERAEEIVLELPDLGDCDDVAVLRGRQPRPTDPARRDAIAALERDLGQLRGRSSTTFSTSGRRALAGEIAAAVTRADATGYAPVVAQARWIQGEVAIDLADGKTAREALLAAAAAAIRGGDPAALADAYLGLATVATELVVDFPAAHAWIDLAAAVIDGLHEPGHRPLQLDHRRARLARLEGDYPAARAALDRALATPGLTTDYRLELGTERAIVDTDAGAYADAQRQIDALLPIATAQLGTNHPRRASLIHDAGNLAYYRGEYARAAELHGEALALREAAFGATSAELIVSLQALGVDENLQGHVDDSRDLLERAITIARRTYGADHVQVASLLSDLGGTYNRAGDYPRELELNREVLAIRRKVLGPDHPDTAMTLVNIGIAAKNLGRARRDRALIDEAIAREEEARTVFVARFGADHFNVGAVDANLGEAYRAAGRSADAVAAFTRAEATFTRAVGADHPAIADPLTGHGQLELELGHAAAAVELLERAVKLRAAPDVDAGDLADSRFALARALRAAGGDPARATELAEQALAVYGARGPGYADRAAEVTRFLGR